MTDDLPRKLLIVLALVMVLFIVLLIGSIIFASETPQEGNQTPITSSELFVRAPNVPYYPTPKTQGTLLDCLVKYESNNNPKAFNPKDTDGKPKYGCLQYGKITFDEFCVEKYQLEDDIWNCDVQRLCASKMIAEGLLGKWGTKDNCI